VSVLLAVLFAAVAVAQTSGGGIEGTVTDPSAASVAGAAIVIEEVDTGLKWKLATSSTGLCSAHSLPVGKYSVLVNASGFGSVKRGGIEVEEGSERVVDVQLAVGPAFHPNYRRRCPGPEQQHPLQFPRPIESAGLR